MQSLRSLPFMSMAAVLCCGACSLSMLVACKGDSKSAASSETAQTKPSEPVATSSDASLAQDASVVALGYRAAIDAAFSEAGLSLGPPLLAGWTLPDGEQRFLGWSKDGSLYVVEEVFGHDEEPGFPPFRVTFTQVRDVHTQSVVAAFQGDPFKDEKVPF